jgi:hypothetical protein
MHYGHYLDTASNLVIHSRPRINGEIMGIRKTEVEHEDMEKHKPLTRAEKAEVKRYEESREKREIVSGYRTKIDKRK